MRGAGCGHEWQTSRLLLTKKKIPATLARLRFFNIQSILLSIKDAGKMTKRGLSCINYECTLIFLANKYALGCRSRPRPAHPP